MADISTQQAVHYTQVLISSVGIQVFSAKVLQMDWVDQVFWSQWK